MVEPILVLQVGCMVAFAMAVTGGIVSVGTTLLILFMYLELHSRKKQHLTHSKPPNTYLWGFNV